MLCKYLFFVFVSFKFGVGKTSQAITNFLSTLANLFIITFIIFRVGTVCYFRSQIRDLYLKRVETVEIIQNEENSKKIPVIYKLLPITEEERELKILFPKDLLN